MNHLGTKMKNRNSHQDSSQKQQFNLVGVNTNETIHQVRKRPKKMQEPLKIYKIRLY